MPRFNNEGRSSKFNHMVNGGRQFSTGGHDDRSKFTIQTARRGGIQKKGRGAFGRLDEAGDVVMDRDALAMAGPSRGHVHFQGTHRKGNKSWRKQTAQNRMAERDTHSFGPSWHKVTIINGNSYDRLGILGALAQKCNVPFIPVTYSIFGSNTVFYVETREMAEAIAECSTQLAAPNGDILTLKVQSCGTPPTSHVDEACENKLKAVLEGRYNAQLQTLSLQNFCMTPELISEYFIPLYRPSVVHKLAELVQPIKANMIGLDLSNNRLSTMEGFQKIINKTALKALNLRDNKIREFHQLERLEAPALVELILEGNPLCDNAKDKETYISAVRKRFPKVVKLDGTDLAPPISFDVSEPIKMPEVKGSCYCNEQAKKVVLRFWELYVTLYDSEDRKPLMDAYHDSASLSIVASYAQAGHVSQLDPTKRLSSYMGDSRNMIRVADKHRRFKLLHQGKIEILASLNKLPKTSHDHNSYSIDMPVAVENFILFNITGIFKEREDRHNPTRCFSRTFTLVPQNSGFVIINEMLYITNATTDQMKIAFKQPAPTPSPSPVPHVQVAVPGPSSTATPASTEEERRQMLALFGQQSGMNEEWSRKCLEENVWDFNKSAYVFTQLKSQNKIPPEAFVK